MVTPETPETPVFITWDCWASTTPVLETVSLIPGPFAYQRDGKVFSPVCSRIVPSFLSTSPLTAVTEAQVPPPWYNTQPQPPKFTGVRWRHKLTVPAHLTFQIPILRRILRNPRKCREGSQKLFMGRKHYLYRGKSQQLNTCNATKAICIPETAKEIPSCTRSASQSSPPVHSFSSNLSRPSTTILRNKRKRAFTHPGPLNTLIHAQFNTTEPWVR